MNLSQRHLQMFVTTAAYCNVSRASEILHISQPALTRALKELESQLGVTLFQRTTRRINLTMEGERFLPVAQRLLNDMTVAIDMVRGEATGQQGSISLAVGEAFGCTVLPAVLKVFAQSYPGVRVRIINDNSQGITRRVDNSEVDFGIGTPVGNTGALLCTPLLSAPLGLLADPSQYKLGTDVDVSDLASLPLLKESNDTSIHHLLSVNGSDVVAWMSIGIEVSSLAQQLALARSGVGVAVLSALGASHYDAVSMKFSQLKPEINRKVFLMQRRDRVLSPSSRALLATIFEHMHSVPLHPCVLVYDCHSSK
ncbi:LysR family transcriptional regulator [Hahella sp. KA22]|uniref:LysR family transcriptional regulator n=1 Tax=Hahella sp. KA22 TaxID=1628392 RepID=UPI000FDE5C4A|nr:LysR family transcriptional regulator [Hahella sp. KA22]AZZ92052.1 LysR family transcriptional regulator [Hahella sp. KA22]QAY55423.1 LysR family transcriptional regulator [Hahella sp. KA22]